MSDDILRKTLRHALSGKDVHVNSRSIFEELDWKIAEARPAGAPHSIFQILNHVVYWQNWVVQWLDGGDPAGPSHASGSWPGNEAPGNKEEWDSAVDEFSRGLDTINARAATVDLFAGYGKKCRLETLQSIASHNSYHLGQAVLLRQMLGVWPPSSGGLTW